MAATMAQTIAQSQPTIRRPVVHPSAVWFRSRSPIAALGLLILLLAAMVPGLARVPARTVSPQSLAAPLTRTTAHPAAKDTVVMTVDPTPQPGY